MRAACGLVLLGMVAVQAAAPPARTRELTAQEQKHVAALSRHINERLKAGAFEEAVSLARQIARYRQERQGSRHWQTIDARLEMQECQRLTLVSPKDRAAVLQANEVNQEGFKLQGEGDYRTALSLYRKALEIRLKTLGSAHPDTATSYNNMAGCLYAQGKAVEALRLFRRALEIYFETLGPAHPNTATSYNNVAGCLDAQGKAGQALPLYRKAMEIRIKTLGPAHPNTAGSCNNVAFCLNAQGKAAEALPLYRKALEIKLETHGPAHPDTALSYNNLASCLDAQGKAVEALHLYRKALEIRLQTLRPAHPDIAGSYNNLASCLIAQCKPGEALPLCRKALEIKLETLGPAHPDTALSYNNLASCLDAQGKAGQALPLYRRALEIRLKTLGPAHPGTATSCNNVAGCLNAQGKAADALPLFRRALEIRIKTNGPAHPVTASSYNNLASCLYAQGKVGEALPLFRRAMVIHLETLGPAHPDTARSYNNLASCLIEQGKPADALPLCRKALEIHLETLGPAHPVTARSYNNLASCLIAQGKPADALPLCRKSLGICIRILGEAHPDTASSYKNVASCLWALGRKGEALRLLQAVLPALEASRFHIAATGFDRAVAIGLNHSPHEFLALGLAHLGQAANAWRYAEASLARGLLDDLVSASTVRNPVGDIAARLATLDARLLPLQGLAAPTEPQRRLREELLILRHSLSARLTVLASEASARRLLPLGQVQAAIPPNAALVLWLDFDSLGEHRACVLRHLGPPAWVSLPGSGSGGAWTMQDHSLPVRVHQALAEPSSDPATRQRLLSALRQQRLVPLSPHLKGVRYLLVVSSGSMAAVPVEALTQKYTVSYIPSGSALVRLMQKHRRLQGSSALVLADPNFQRPQARPPAAPSHGLLIASVTPGSLARKIGLRAGDVLLQYDGTRLNRTADFKEATGDGRVAIRLWREGRVLTAQVPSGKLGISLDSRPVVEALPAWHKKQTQLLASLSHSGDWEALPGTRLEAAALRGLVPSASLLAGSDASEQRLRELADSGKLSSFRLLHLASHGEANAARPEQTALILAQDHLPPGSDAQAQDVLAGKKPLDGRLPVATVLKSWKLDADLVVLSACQSGLGKKTSGEGMLGFAHALLARGAHSVVLSRWKVDDDATALLMTRFYENLLVRKLRRAEALHEAKRWLRELPTAEAEKRLAKLLEALPRGERGRVAPARAAVRPGEKPPFADPYYWAAFVLIGDPS